MNATSNIIAMQRAIISYIESRIPKDQNKAHLGRVTNGRVIIGNQSFLYTPAVDMYFGNGDNVACILPEQANIAVVVGVP